MAERGLIILPFLMTTKWVKSKPLFNNGLSQLGSLVWVKPLSISQRFNVV